MGPAGPAALSTNANILEFFDPGPTDVIIPEGVTVATFILQGGGGGGGVVSFQDFNL
jgi:hypothetical protein